MPPSPYIRRLRAKIGHELLILPSVAVILFDDRERLLMARTTLDHWMIIGGAIDPDETPADAAKREVWEETGLLVEPQKVIGVFAGPEFQFAYENGDQVSYTITAFEARRVGGEPLPDGEEAFELRFVTPAEADALPMAPHMRLLVRCAFEQREQPYFAPATWTPPMAEA